MTSEHGRGTYTLLLAALLSLSLSGCASFWDDMTAKDTSVGAKLKGIFVKPEPLVVLRDSKDGDERAKALRALREPKQRGGSDQEQDFMVDLLAKSATTEKQPLCRLAAIQKLGTFKDPRVAKHLEAAFYQVDDFTPEVATRIQCAAIAAMGDNNNPQAIPFLVEKLKEPQAERSDLAQQRNDRCVAAARALGHYKDYQVTEALAAVLQRSNEDIALRDCAHASLQLATGKKLPAEFHAWDEFLHPKDEKALAKQNQNRTINLAGWFQE